MKRYIKASESPEFLDLWNFLHQKTSEKNSLKGGFDFNIEEYTDTYCKVSLNNSNTARTRKLGSWLKEYFKDRVEGEVDMRLYNKVAEVSVHLRPMSSSV